MRSNKTVSSGFDNEYLSRKIAIESEKKERGVFTCIVCSVSVGYLLALSILSISKNCSISFAHCRYIRKSSE
jgi:hypothetical protein